MHNERTLYTIGHSNHPTPHLIELLRAHGVTTVVDVRSQPYSKWAHQFNRETLARELQAAGLTYRYMGDCLGGRPDDRSLYAPGEDRPDYERMEQTKVYQDGIERLLQWAREEQVALMCSEGDHRHCHRHLLIAQTLLARGARVCHIQPDGTTREASSTAQQLSLFG